ncbi:hypothetical protein Tco_1548446 [Tanacetum coccineum]
MGKAVFDPKGGRCGGNGERGGSMAGRGGGWLAKRSIVLNKGCGGGGLAVRGGRSLSESKKGRGDVGGVEKISSTDSKLMDNREIPGEVIGESGRDTIGLDGGSVW